MSIGRRDLDYTTDQTTWTSPWPVLNVIMWGGKGGGPLFSQQALGGYVSFVLNNASGRDIPFDESQRCSIWKWRGSPGGGDAPSVYGYAGGGASVMLELNTETTIAVSAGGGGYGGGNYGGNGGLNGEDGINPAGYDTLAGKGAKFNAVGLGGYKFGNTPDSLRDGKPPIKLSLAEGGYEIGAGGDGSTTAGDISTNRAGGGGAGRYGGGAGAGGGSNTTSIFPAGSGGGGSNYIMTSPDIIPLSNRTATRGAGKPTTHPLYISPYGSTPPRQAKEGFIRIYGYNSLNDIVAIMPTITSTIPSQISVARSLALTGTAQEAISGDPIPIVFKIDGGDPITSTTDQPPMVQLAAGVHSIELIAQSITGAVATTTVSINVLPLPEIELLSVVSGVLSATPPTSFLAVFENTLVTFNFRHRGLGQVRLEAASTTETLGLLSIDWVNTSRTYAANQLSNCYFVASDPNLPYTAQPISFAIQKIAIVPPSSTTLNIVIASPPNNQYYLRTAQIPFNVSCFTSDGRDVSSSLVWESDLFGGVVHTDGGSFTLNPLATSQGISLPVGQQTLQFRCTDPVSNNEAIGEIVMFLSDANITITSPTSQVGPHVYFEDVASIDFNGTAVVNYGVGPIDLTPQLQFFLDNETTPFGYFGSGTLIAPTLGLHTVRAVLRNDYLAPVVSTVWAETLIELDIQPLKVPLIFNISSNLVRSLAQSFQVSGESSDFSGLVSLTDSQVWSVNGNDVGMGASALLDQLVIGVNIARLTVTDPDTNLSAFAEIIIDAEAATTDCIADGAQALIIDDSGSESSISISDLIPGTILVDYQHRPVPLVGIVKVGNPSQRFVSLKVGDFPMPLLLTKNHPILFNNQEIHAQHAVGQSGVDIYVSEKSLEVYHIITPQRTFVKIQGVCVATISQADWNSRSYE